MQGVAWRATSIDDVITTIDVEDLTQKYIRVWAACFLKGIRSYRAIQLRFIDDNLLFTGCSDWRSLVHRGTARGCLSSPSPTPRAGSRHPHIFGRELSNRPNVELACVLRLEAGVLSRALSVR